MCRSGRRAKYELQGLRLVSGATPASICLIAYDGQYLNCKRPEICPLISI